MRKNPTSQSGIFNPRVLVAFALCSVGVFLPMLSFGAALPSGVMENVEVASAPNWVKIGSYSPPISRQGSAMARDVTGRTVLFGGSRYYIFASVMNDTWRFNGSRWIQLQPATSPPPGAFTAMAYDPIRQETVLFITGSGAPSGPLGETWVWDGQTWTQRMPVFSPPARFAAGMAWDEATRKVILFGGTSSDPLGASRLNDTWSWDGVQWTLETPLLSPTPRGWFGFADGSATSTPVLFGGAPPDPQGVVYLGDTWLWDGIGRTWVPAALTGPAARAGLILGFDPARGKTILYGGFDKPNPIGALHLFGDTWSWDGSAWTQLSPSKSPWLSTRIWSAVAFDTVEQRLRLFGGQSYSPSSIGNIGGLSQDTWGWNGTTWIHEDVTAPDEMQKPMFARDPINGWVMFGGQYEYYYYSQETWRWDGSEWQALNPANKPPPRGMAAMTYDPSNRKTIMFGGNVDMLLYAEPRVRWEAADTWSWDGTDWTLLQPANSPPARSEAMITYDAANGQVVLFGGGYADEAKNDTWVWDGTNWIEKQPANSPPARIAGSMAYDPVRGRVVLFGGIMSGASGYYNDTWIWDGTDWTEVLAQNSPPMRAFGGMGFDNSTQSIIYFGGCSGCYADPTYDETWSFDGSSWTQLYPATQLERMTSFAVASGDQNIPLLLFGGRRAFRGGGAFYPEGTEHINAVWAFSAATPLLPTSVVSRKTHGSAGTFDINLPSDGSGIECRTGGASGDYTLVFSFVNTVTSCGVASTGAVSSGPNANQCTVSFTGVANAQTLTVTLTGATDSTGATGVVSGTMGVLLGDTTADRTVNSGDIAQTKSRSGQVVDSTNFRSDVTVDGNLNSADIGLVKSKSGTAIP